MVEELAHATFLVDESRPQLSIVSVARDANRAIGQPTRVELRLKEGTSIATAQEIAKELQTHVAGIVATAG